VASAFQSDTFQNDTFQTTAPLPPGALDISAMWAAKYGTLTAGQKLFVTIEYFNKNTGQRSGFLVVPITVSA
jgi:hypothetical protein